MGDRLLTVLETAQQFNLTTGLLYTAIAKGELAVVRFRPRGRIRVREADVRDWIESHASGADVRTQRQTGLPDAPSRAVSNIERLLPPKAFRRFA
jgi:excisionase family DNA binding protein